MKQILFVVEEALEGGFVAKALGESIFTEADSIEELYSNIREAVHCHFDSEDAPSVIRIQFLKEDVIAA